MTMTMKVMVRLSSVLIIRILPHFISFSQVGRVETEVPRGEMGPVLMVMTPQLHLKPRFFSWGPDSYGQLCTIHHQVGVPQSPQTQMIQK